METHRRHQLEASAALVGAALFGGLATASWRVVVAIDRTVHLVANGGHADSGAPVIAALLLSLASLALLVGAVRLAIAARRASRLLERASLVEIS